MTFPSRVTDLLLRCAPLTFVLFPHRSQVLLYFAILLHPAVPLILHIMFRMPKNHTSAKFDALSVADRQKNDTDGSSDGLGARIQHQKLDFQGQYL